MCFTVASDTSMKDSGEVDHNISCEVFFFLRIDHPSQSYHELPSAAPVLPVIGESTFAGEKDAL